MTSNIDTVTLEAFRVCKKDLLNKMNQSSETLTGSLALPKGWVDEQRPFLNKILEEHDFHSKDWETIVRQYETLEEIILAVHFITMVRARQMITRGMIENIDDPLTKMLVTKLLKS